MVHIYSMQGLNIAIDGNSGCIHVVDDVAGAIIEEYHRCGDFDQVGKVLADRFDPLVIRDTLWEIDSLRHAGLLFTPDLDPSLLSPPVQPGQNLKALCLHVAHDCNLACSYCFASKGSYKVAKKLMPRQTAFKAIDFLLAHSGDKKNVEIDFFGGEPTLNFQVVQDTVAYGRQAAPGAGKQLNFTITTNGTLLDQEKTAYINEHMDNVVISLDGRPSIHDQVRPTANGENTYQTVMDEALRLVAARGDKSHYIRGTFTSRNPDFWQDVLHLADVGFTEISLEPVVGRDGDLYLNPSHLPAILASYERLADDYLNRIRDGRPYRFYHFNVDIYQGPCLQKRVSACGAGTEYLAVTPEGDLYPCHQFVGEPAFKMGDLDQGITNYHLGEQFRQANIFTKESCRNCWAKLFCSGGCHANSYYTNKDITQPEEMFCAMQKKRLECAITIEAWKSQQE